MLKSIGVLIVLVVGAAGWWVTSPADAEKKKPGSELLKLTSSLESMRKGEVRIRRKLQALQQDLYELRTKTGELAHSQAQVDTAPAGTNASGEASDHDETDGTAQEQAAPPVEMEVVLQEAFEQSSRDSAWTDSALDDVMAAVTPTLPQGSAVSSNECRGELCRIEVAHETEGGHRAFVETLLRSPTNWRGPGSIRLVQTEDGDEATLAFFGKPGSDADEGSVWRGGVAQR